MASIRSFKGSISDDSSKSNSCKGVRVRLLKKEEVKRDLSKRDEMCKE